jgi:diguanylate cyclase (GGDEF)-like protein/PAS domain S-box-containing protein
VSDPHEAVAKAALQALPVGLYIVDRDLRIVAWNAERERGPFGRPAAEVLGRPLSEILPKEGYEALLPRLRRVLESGESFDEVAESPQGGKIRAFRVLRRPIYQDGVVTHVLSLFEEVTAEQERERFLRTLDKAVRTMQLGVTVTDLQGTILYTNPADARMHGWTVEELIGKHASVFAPSGRRRPLHPEQLRAMKSWRRESVNITKDGRHFPVQLLSDVVYDLHDNPVGLVTTCEDITERRRAAEQIESLAYRDLLTGLPNRRLFTDRLDLAVSNAQRQRQKLAVIFADLDGFKLVNDSLGHDWGDELLRHVARRIEGCLRHGDTVARLGGDEFTLLLPGIEKSADVEKIAAKVLDALRPPLKLGPHEFYCTASLGVAVYPDHGETLEVLLKNADAAMYRAKEDGRDTFRVFASAMGANVLDRLSVENELRAALVEGQLLAHYQPIVRAGTGEVLALEALVRWKHPVRGLLAPGEFLPLAETSGAILPLGAFMLWTALAQLREWHDLGLSHLAVSVNVSARQFQHSGLADDVASALKAARIPPDKLILEVAEADCMQKPQQTLQALRELKGLGAGVALDDFGVGFSSLAHLKRLPVDYLKIDRSFTADVTKDQDAAAIASAVIGLARTFGFQVVAEGVETEAQRAFLEAERCTALQGDLFASARPAEELKELLLGRSSQARP